VVIDTGPTETRQNKPLFRVDDGVRPKNNLTEPALLEMSGNATNQELTHRRGINVAGELQQMRFEERELKPYAEPIPPEELKYGETYFAVLYVDDDGVVPTLEPLVFIGKDLEPEDEEKLYFQDYDSYRSGVRFETATPDDGAIFHTGREKHVFDYEHALDQLMACALRRRETRRTK
jgi:hypothetical protein